MSLPFRLLFALFCLLCLFGLLASLATLQPDRAAQGLILWGCGAVYYAMVRRDG